MSPCIHHPNPFEYYDDWQTRKLPERHQEHNDWVIGQVRRMIDRRYQQHIDNDADRAEALASELIRGFRYFVERSQGISYGESPDSSSGINSQASVRSIGETERGYCPECVRNYASADMDEVFTFHQALPAEDAFSEGYLGWRHPIDEQERASIRAYAESLRSESNSIRGSFRK